jgi:hypothetical protein
MDKNRTRNAALALFLILFFRAHDWTRTSTPYGTTPSRWRVYQFHHVRVDLNDLHFANLLQK